MCSSDLLVTPKEATEDLSWIRFSSPAHRGERCAGSVGPLAFSLTCGTAYEQTDDGLRASAGWLRREIEEG